MNAIDARRAANRAELYAIALRRLAKDIEAAARCPSDVRIDSILTADRGEVIGAADRLLDALQSVETIIADGKFQFPGPVNLQADAIDKKTAKPDALRMWADRWDAYAVSIDP